MKKFHWSFLKKKIQLEPKAQEVSTSENFLLQFEIEFGNTLWAQDILDHLILDLDKHHMQEHQYLEDCDVLCAKDVISRYLNGIEVDQAKNLAMVVIKYWYHCWAVLRYHHKNSNHDHDD